MADYAGASAAGAIECLHNDLSLIIDEDETDTHKAVIELSGAMVFVFKPYDNASSDIKANGVDLQYTVEVSTQDITYTPDGKTSAEQIFALKADATALNKGTKITDANATTIYSGLDLTDHIGDFAVVINGTDLADKVTFGTNTFTLDTLDEYHAFQEALGKGQLGITVSAVDPQVQ